MSYKRMNGATEIIARQGYSGLGFGLDDITGAMKGALNFYGQSEQAKGAAKASQEIAIAQAQAAQKAAQSGGTPMAPAGCPGRWWSRTRDAAEEKVVSRAWKTKMHSRRPSS